MLFKSLLSCAALARLGIAGYTLADDYEPSSFFDMFDFYTDTDPTHGFVDYVDRSTAESNGLLNVTSDSVSWGVDSTNTASSDGRMSVRLSSTATYNHGLIILDAAHMPGAACGVWPAFWSFGPNWPNQGEIDIIEGVNLQTYNDMTLHTAPGCSIETDSSSNFEGTLVGTDCEGSTGCQIAASDDTTYGDGFNNAGGGVYATEWTSDVIRIWFFSRGNIPSDISNGSPDPSTWSTPLASFSLSCSIDDNFKDHSIIFDTTFCGDWAGSDSVWSASTCSSYSSTCQDYVQNNPSAFTNAYWAINSLKVYQSDSSSNSSATTTSASPSTSDTTNSSATSYVPSYTTLLTYTTPYTSSESTSVSASATSPINDAAVVTTPAPYTQVLTPPSSVKRRSAHGRHGRSLF